MEQQSRNNEERWRNLVVHEMYEMTAGAGLNPAPAVISYISCTTRFLHSSSIVCRSVMGILQGLLLLLLHIATTKTYPEEADSDGIEDCSTNKDWRIASTSNDQSSKRGCQGRGSLRSDLVDAICQAPMLPWNGLHRKDLKNADRHIHRTLTEQI